MGAPPYELVLGWLCERFHKIPEEIEDCDMSRLLRVVGLTGIYDTFKKLQRGERLTPEEHEMCGVLLRLDLERQKRGLK